VQVNWWSLLRRDQWSRSEGEDDEDDGEDNGEGGGGEGGVGLDPEMGRGRPTNEGGSDEQERIKKEQARFRAGFRATMREKYLHKPQ
jgi:hypothetical protein